MGRSSILLAAAVAFLSSLTLGCSEDSCGGRYRLGDSLPSAEAQLVLHAAEDVNGFTGRRAIVIGPTERCSVEAKAVGPHPEGGMILGRRQRDEGVWLDLASIRQDDSVRDEASYRDLVRVIATHEFLHAAGMNHHGGTGVMNGGPNADARFTAQDHEACVDDGACE